MQGMAAGYGAFLTQRKLTIRSWGPPAEGSEEDNSPLPPSPHLENRGLRLAQGEGLPRSTMLRREHRSAFHIRQVAFQDFGQKMSCK